MLLPILALGTAARAQEPLRALPQPLRTTADASLAPQAVAAARFEVQRLVLFVETGAPALLDETLAPSFTDHAPVDGAVGGRSALESWARQRRAGRSGMRCTLDELLVVGDRAVARTTCRAAGRGSAAVDMLRLVDGRIAERWHLDGPWAEVASTAPCTAARFVARRDGADAGAGQRRVDLLLRNVGDAACTLAGYATLQLLDAAGRAVPDVGIVYSAGGDLATDAPATPVTVAPGGSARFTLAFSGATGGRPCAHVATLLLVPPVRPASAARAVRLSTPLEVCGTRVTVTPVRAP